MLDGARKGAARQIEPDVFKRGSNSSGAGRVHGSGATVPARDQPPRRQIASTICHHLVSWHGMRIDVVVRRKMRLSDSCPPAILARDFPGGHAVASRSAKWVTKDVSIGLGFSPYATRWYSSLPQEAKDRAEFVTPRNPLKSSLPQDSGAIGCATGLEYRSPRYRSPSIHSEAFARSTFYF